MHTYFVQASDWLWLPGDADPTDNREGSAVVPAGAPGAAVFARYAGWLENQPDIGAFTSRLIDPNVRRDRWFNAVFTSPLTGEGVDGAIPIDTFCQDVIYNPQVVQIISPFLALITNNRAHHFSLAMAHRAFSSSPYRNQNPHRLVINFDQHEDYGTTGPGTLRCSNWGPYLFNRTAQSLQAVNGHQETAVTLRNNRVADTYAVLGLAKGFGSSGMQPDTSTQCRLKMRGSVSLNQPPIGGNPLHLGAAITEIFNQLPDGEQIDVFITLDRDVMKWSCTGWDDGAYQPQLIRQAVTDCIQRIGQAPNMNLVGMDITGAPCSDYHTDMAHFARAGHVKEDAQLLCADDIRQVKAALQAVFPTPFTIKVSSPYPDDSRSLEYSVRKINQARSTQGTLNSQGEVVIEGFNTRNCELSFPGHDRNWVNVATLRTNTSYALGSGDRYSFTIHY